MSNLYNRIESLCTKKGISITQMCKESGASRGSLGDLASNRIQNLSSTTLQKIAEYFNVSTDYLTGETNYKNIKEARDCDWGLDIPDFDVAFNFAGLLKEIREDMDISLSELGQAIGETAEQMEEIENGWSPITYEQAEKLCGYLDTNVSQVLFDNELYTTEVPEKYHNNVKEWERIQREIDKEAMKETSEVLNPDIRMIARAGKKMTPEQAENLRKYAQFMFPEAFKDD